MKIRRSIVGQTNVCCNRYSDGTIFVGALTDFMHRKPICAGILTAGLMAVFVAPF